MSNGSTLIIFDVDGTLVYSDKRDSKTFAHTYREIYGKPFPTIDWHQFPHVTDTTIFQTVIQQHFQRDAVQEEIAEFQGAYIAGLEAKRKQSPHHYKEIPGAAGLITALHEHAAYEIAVATGGWQKPAEVKLRHIDIDPARMPIIGADGKITREEIVNGAIEAAGTTFKKIVYVGDALWDVRTTRNLGLGFVGIRHRNDFAVLSEQGAQHVLSNFQDIDHFLRLVNQSQIPSLPRSM